MCQGYVGKDCIIFPKTLSIGIMFNGTCIPLPFTWFSIVFMCDSSNYFCVILEIPEMDVRKALSCSAPHLLN
uniref:Uncharacterized protein n=1 Tax=Anguilla anguilla TaxID=7936 RepID=A0A0E9WYS7_ANGAN